MPPDNPRNQDLLPLQEIQFMPSTIETIDRALFDYIDDELNIFCTTNKGFNKIPFIWVGAERAYQIKHNKDLRDANGWLIYPIMTLERISVEKDVTKRGALYASVPNRQDNKGGTMTVARVIKQDKTANFANADSKRLLMNTSLIGTGQNNFPRKNPKVVYETITMPIPIYLEIGYTLIIKSEYQQQINEAMTPFMTTPAGPNYFNVYKDGHSFEVFIDPNYELNNNAAALMEDPRGYQAQISFRVRGYIIGGDKNEERPKIVRRENAVEVKLPREHVIFGDIPEHLHISGNVPFYRE
tara:strand:- start:405 stop:1298 length:894 start_codon:yes stop_codon:yes gene_type:complete